MTIGDAVEEAKIRAKSIVKYTYPEYPKYAIAYPKILGDDTIVLKKLVIK